MKKILLFLLICLTTLSAVYGEETVWQDNFDNPATAAAWTFTGKRTTKHRYTCAGFAKENESRILLLQDFDFASQPATALSPKFKAGEAWEIACDFRFTPPDWGADKPPYSFRIKLLDKSGAILCNLDVRYRRMVPGGMLLNRLPIADNTWYRLKLTAKHADRLYDLSVTDVNTGKTQELKDLPLASSQSPERILFEAVCGYDSFGVLRIDNLAVTNHGKAIPRNRPELGRLGNNRLKLKLCADGVVEVDFRNQAKGPWLRLGTFNVPTLPNAPRPAVKFRAVKLQNDNPVLPRIDYDMVATTTDMKGSGNQVLGIEALDADGKPLYLMQWTLFPEAARLRIYPSWKVNEEWQKNLIALPFVPGPKMKEKERVQAERFYLHRTGGVPEDVNRGQGIEFGNREGTATIAVNGASPTFWKFWTDGSIHFETRRYHIPWSPDFYCGAMTISVRNDQGARRREAIARAGEEWLLMEVSYDEDFFLIKKPGLCRVTAHVGNYFRKAQRIDVHYVIRDYNGKVLKEATESRIVRAGGECTVPISVMLDQIGPVFFDIDASHEYGGDFFRICGGLLPKYQFRAGKESRIGVSGWNRHPGDYLTKRTPAQVLAMMKHLGISTVRQCYNSEEIAHQLGLRTWYHMSWDGKELRRLAAGEKSYLSDPKIVEDRFRHDLEHTRKTGSEVYEFSNELNLSGGELQAKLGKAYASLLPSLQKVRNKSYPEIKTTGLTIANGDMPFMQAVYDAGAWNCFDYLVFHATGVTRSPEKDDSYWSFLRTLRAVREACREFGDKPLYISEFYAPSAPNLGISRNERLCAQIIGIQMALCVAADIKNVMFYIFCDMELERFLDPNKSPDLHQEAHFGLFRRNWSPKPQTWAFWTAAKFFDPGEFLGDLKFDDPTIRGLFFDKGPNGKFAMLWSRKDGLREQEAMGPQGFHRAPWVASDLTPPKPLILKALDGKSIRVTDIVGNSRELKANPDGNVTLDLGESPVYVEGAEFSPVKGEFFNMLSPKAGPDTWIRMPGLKRK